MPGILRLAYAMESLCNYYRKQDDAPGELIKTYMP